MFVATLIAADGLEDAVVERARQSLSFPDTKAEAVWLDAGAACDIVFDLGDMGRASGVGDDGVTLAHIWLDDMFRGIDVVVQPLASRAKRLLIADMDSTMITVEGIDELADYAGLKPRIAAITEAAMRGELDFAGALDARVALLKGLDAGAIDRCREERVRLMPGARTLVRTMKARGATTVLVSGGFTAFADPVGAEIGFDRVIANRLEIAGDALAGAVAKPIVDAGTKLATLNAVRDELGLELDATLAVGDGANDLPMIQAAGLGVAFHAKPVVAAAAAARIDHGDLTALLWAQGIPRAEWITG